jgi:rhodanese-related sulfurtransferase
MTKAAADEDRIQAQRRKLAYKIVDPDQVKEYAKDPTAVWLDVRDESEIANPRLGFVSTDKLWMHATCNETTCPLLQAAAENMIKSKTAKVIVYCSSGRRAYLAQTILEKKGYTNVRNAGGLVDVFYPTKDN